MVGSQRPQTGRNERKPNLWISVALALSFCPFGGDGSGFPFYITISETGLSLSGVRGLLTKLIFSAYLFCNLNFLIAFYSHK